MNKSVEILCIGNELLIGKTLNTNAQWLAKQVTSLGLTTNRITVVGDNINEISCIIQETVHRSPHFVLITGGLGPTFDDKTLEGIAKALGRNVEVNKDALEMVREKYVTYAAEDRMEEAELTPARVKMAKLPEQATPLPNPVGTAPAVSIQHKNVKIFALPGVPPEMKSIFNTSIAPLMKHAASGVTFFEASINSTNVMESKMAPIIDKVMQNNPHVYIKSHPKGTERLPHIEFHFSTTANDEITARNHVNKALSELTELIQQNGGTIKSPKTKT
ncbi:MAG: nicotinamide mononucleotide deamidase-related protein [Candidatus Bathyarchaeota archaeon]|nr:nicotinamide mononucleotide deamidase-related protein [Candidatus Bathyarchaeum sp.]